MTTPALDLPELRDQGRRDVADLRRPWRPKWRCPDCRRAWVSENINDSCRCAAADA